MSEEDTLLDFPTDFPIKIMGERRDDFAQATSSRSTKLLHGGVRYLRQGNLKLVMGALRERGRVLGNAPHLASEQPFIIPTYKRGESLYYGFGLGVYERLAGRFPAGLADIPELPEELSGAVRSCAAAAAAR